MTTKENSFKRFFFIYFQMVKLAWRVKKELFIATTFMNALLGILVLPSLYIDKLLIDTVLKAISTHDVQFGIRNVTILIVCTVLVDFVSRTWDRFDWAITQTLARLLTVEVQLMANNKINKLPVSLAESPEVRDKFRKITDKSGTSVWSMIMPMAAMPYVFFTIVSALIAISGYGFFYVVPALLLAIPDIMVGVKNSRIMHKAETKLSSMWRIWAAYDDFVSKGRYIYENKILGHVDGLLVRSRSVSHEVIEQRYHRWIDSSRRRVASSVPIWVFGGAIRGYFFIQAILGKITLGTAQMQTRAVNQLISSFSGLGRQITDIYENYLFVHDFREFMDMKEEADEGMQPHLPFDEGIEFKDVWFRYPQNNGWTLKGVSFKVGLHDNIAIVGKNGAGKTTIIKLLCSFYKPQKGQILVNGKNILDYSPLKYRKVISALFQDFAQYPFSAKENVGYGDITRMEDLGEIKKSAKLVGIDEFIEGLPKKYENALDNEFEGGIEPSKGQWQKLALARALFRKAEIFILDEPTSNVDPEAEEEIFDKIIKLATDKIVFLVSHRFSTVVKADKILLLADGKVKEYGSHKELLGKDGEYARLFRLQAKAYQESK